MVENSRRLTGHNLYVSGPAAVAEVSSPDGGDLRCLEAWEVLVLKGCAALGIPKPELFIATHKGGAAVGFTAPIDMLYGATELNEWALKASFAYGEGSEAVPFEAVHAQITATLQAERNQAVIALQREALRYQRPFLWDDDHVSVGLGRYAETWAASEIPDPQEIAWSERGAIPVGIITGTNGKTTTSRLLTRMLIQHGFHVGATSTDGVSVDEVLVEGGDWTGPGAARMVLRRPEIDAAVLETARGGLLRRGLGYEECDVAVVTNVAADHLGEYGIHDVEDMARVKALVYDALKVGGIRVVNADDPRMHPYITPRVEETTLFSLEDGHPMVRAHCSAGGTAWTLRAGVISKRTGSQIERVIDVAEAPLMMGGAAHHNIANGLAASAAAEAMGASLEAICAALASFGDKPGDNPGRCQLITLGGVQVIMDFGHNPHGLSAILGMAGRLLADTTGRIGVSVGQAGDRTDPEILGLCDMLHAHRAERIMLRDMAGYERGRRPGEVAEMMASRLVDLGIPPDAISIVGSETAALEEAMSWAQPGDVILLLVHLQREAVQAWLQQFHGDALEPSND